MNSPTIAALSAVQTLFSAHNLYLVILAVRKLKRYEEISEKAAEYSNIAEKQLHKTKSTEASGTGAIALSLVSSFGLTLYFLSTRRIFLTARMAVAFINICNLEFSAYYVGEYWDGKMKIPLPKAGDYNDAISLTQRVKFNMGYMVYLWTIMFMLIMILGAMEYERVRL